MMLTIDLPPGEKLVCAELNVLSHPSYLTRPMRLSEVPETYTLRVYNNDVNQTIIIREHDSNEKRRNRF